MSEKHILSPLPGTFYHKPSPDAEAYKNAGDTVYTGDVIGLMEIMKSFHEIKADKDGIIKHFLVEDGAPVSPGIPLLELE